MNRITRVGADSFGLTPVQFRSLVRHIFDDPFDISEEYVYHSECRVILGAEIDLDVAKEIIDCIAGNTNFTPEDLVGTWMCETYRDDGIQWSLIEEIQKCHQVTETKIVTTWKPICENPQQTTCPVLAVSKE